MRRLHTLTTGAVLAAALAGGWAWAQDRADAAGTLTGADLAEIRQLYARYNQGLDFRDKELFLSAFAEDAVYTTGGGDVRTGVEGLTAWVTPLLGAGPTTLSHNNTSILIEPTAAGARGRGYWMLMNVEQRPPAPVFSGYYEDTYVKTAAGWRIQSRRSVRGWAQASQ